MHNIRFSEMVVEPVPVEVTSLPADSGWTIPWLGIMSFMVALASLLISFRVANKNHQRWEVTEASNQTRWTTGIKLEVYAEVIRLYWDCVEKAALFVGLYQNQPDNEDAVYGYQKSLVGARSGLASVQSRLSLVAPKSVVESFNDFERGVGRYIRFLVETEPTSDKDALAEWRKQKDSISSEAHKKMFILESLMTLDLGVKDAFKDLTPKQKDTISKLIE